MPDELEQLATFLDNQLDKLHVLANKPQDIDFEDVTNEQAAQPQKQTDKERFEAKLKEMREREEAKRQERERRSQLTPEQRQVEDKARFDAKLAEMRSSNPTNPPKKDYYQRERSLFNDLER